LKPIVALAALAALMLGSAAQVQVAQGAIPLGEPAPDCRARVSFDRNQEPPGYQVPQSASGGVCVPFLPSLYQAPDDVLFDEHRDLKAAKAFFRSARTVTGVTPDRVMTNGYDNFPACFPFRAAPDGAPADQPLPEQRAGAESPGHQRPLPAHAGLQASRLGGTVLSEPPYFVRLQFCMEQHGPAASRRIYLLRRIGAVLAMLEAA
jgi:hypothetical protein